LCREQQGAEDSGGEDYVTELLAASDRSFSYKQAGPRETSSPKRVLQMEGDFTQPNGRVCEEVLSWAGRATEGGRED